MDASRKAVDDTQTDLLRTAVQEVQATSSAMASHDSMVDQRLSALEQSLVAIAASVGPAIAYAASMEERSQAWDKRFRAARSGFGHIAQAILVAVFAAIAGALVATELNASHSHAPDPTPTPVVAPTPVPTLFAGIHR